MTWDDLPEPVRAAVEVGVGSVAEAEEIVGGQNNDVTAVLRVGDGDRVFLKGVRGVSRRMRWLRNEVTAAQVATGFAPAVVFHADVDDWFVVVSEYVPGRPASLAPGSPDLPLVADVLTELSVVRVPQLRSLRDRWAVTDWWDRLPELAPDTVRDWDIRAMSGWSARVPDLVDGDRLLHTDLHGHQFRIGSGNTVRIIDWGFPGRGAPWVDSAFVALRLVEAGHSHAEADIWARRPPTMEKVDDHALTAFAVYLAGFWTYRCATDTTPGWTARARLARDHAAWRLDQQSRQHP